MTREEKARHAHQRAVTRVKRRQQGYADAKAWSVSWAVGMWERLLEEGDRLIVSLSAIKGQV